VTDETNWGLIAICKTERWLAGGEHNRRAMREIWSFRIKCVCGVAAR